MMDRVICLVQCAWGVVEHVSRIFGRPLLMTPSGWGLVVNLCNFWILPVQHFVLVGLFWLGLGFSRPVSAETFLWRV